MTVESRLPAQQCRWYSRASDAEETDACDAGKCEDVVDGLGTERWRRCDVATCSCSVSTTLRALAIHLRRRCTCSRCGWRCFQAGAFHVFAFSSATLKFISNRIRTKFHCNTDFTETSPTCLGKVSDLSVTFWRLISDLSWGSFGEFADASGKSVYWNLAMHGTKKTLSVYAYLTSSSCINVMTLRSDNGQHRISVSCHSTNWTEWSYCVSWIRTRLLSTLNSFIHSKQFVKRTKRQCWIRGAKLFAYFLNRNDRFMTSRPTKVADIVSELLAEYAISFLTL